MTSESPDGPVVIKWNLFITSGCRKTPVQAGMPLPDRAWYTALEPCMNGQVLHENCVVCQEIQLV